MGQEGAAEPEPAGIELSENAKDSAGAADEESGLLGRGAEASTSTTPSDKPQGSDCRCVLWALSAVALLLLWVWALAMLFLYLKEWWQGPEVKFFVVGDWGRNGKLNQSAVADLMANKAETLRPEFIISSGDNMYDSGLISAEDKQFTTSFTEVYHHESLQVPWHVVLGNHDYGEFWNGTENPKTCPVGATDCHLSPLHQLNQRLVERDARWHCERWFQLPLPHAEAELFFIDTNPFIQSYHALPWAANKGGILEQSWDSQILELEASLAASTAKWKLVIGHHPVLSNEGENTPDLVAQLQPVLESQGVQAYFSGHAHNLQYLHVDNSTVHYVVSGGGSLTDYPLRYQDNGGSRFRHQGSGFVSCMFKLDFLECDYWGIAQTAKLYSFKVMLE